MKVGKTLVGIILVVGLAVAGCASPDDSDIQTGPADGTTPSYVLQLMDSARTSIDVIEVSLTRPGIFKALMNARRRGVTIRVLTDKNQSQTDRQRVVIQRLRAAGITVKLSESLEYNKVEIVDRAAVAGGSLIWRDEWGQIWSDDFQRMWDAAPNPSSR